MTTKTFMYRDFVRTLSERVIQSLSTIETEHNFEYGVEFEIAMCDALRSALPDRYGINRGYVVDAEGTAAGDDIVISARERFPTLALRGRDDFARKEFVPIEAAYCYIEAKHSIVLTSDGRQSLSTACEQVSRVKKLCRKRPDIAPGQVNPYFNISGGILSVNSPPEFPNIQNPMFGAVFARHVRLSNESDPIEDPKEIESLLKGRQILPEQPPDLIVLGDSLVIVPAIDNKVRSPFFIPQKSAYHTRVVDHVSFGIALTSIMAALDWIQLGVLPWHRITIDALDIPFS